MTSSCIQRTPSERVKAHRKTTLICPTCGHESVAGTDGDWAVTDVTTDDDRRVAYECPVCWDTIVVQPTFECR